MMMTNLKKFLCLTLALICTCNLAGCSGANAPKQSKEEKVSLILDSYMKAITKQDYSDYATNFQMDAETATADIETFIADFAEGVVGYEMGSDLKTKYAECFKKVLQNCKVTVGEAKKSSGDSYTVSVTIEKLNLFTTALEKANKDYIDELMAVDYEVSDKKANKLFLECALARVEEGLQSPTYGEAKTITVTMVGADDDTGRYDISDEDLGIIMAELSDFSAWAEDASEDNNLEAEAYEEILTEE